MNNPTRLLRPGYWCECWTQSPAPGEAPTLVASIDVATAADAIRWIRIALRTITPALDRSASRVAWAWLTTGQLDAVEALQAGKPCFYVAHHATTTIEWTARPVTFLALVHRRPNAPPCADTFRPHP
ncbi:hypothetical protein [Actinacidiphila rubida]|uniref:Uncharacterized protein n=1 Tax=Actinacidiphila rubida TaxID=310780 RepID=A0A1H8MXS5_9ACTN|nr:hypothetical protein [Actinacidiphila rubida]SEO22069.1 hypothetical protein SAMN05216267_102067 [Actinacidiphila rubida]